jgi:hypothetical protein
MRGNITRRGKSSWRLKFDLEPDPITGKRQTRVLRFAANAKMQSASSLAFSTKRMPAIGPSQRRKRSRNIYARGSRKRTISRPERSSTITTLSSA